LKASSATTARIGLLNAMVIWKNIRSSDAPSIVAAS